RPRPCHRRRCGLESRNARSVWRSFRPGGGILRQTIAAGPRANGRTWPASEDLESPSHANRRNELRLLAEGVASSIRIHDSESDDPYSAYPLQVDSAFGQSLSDGHGHFGIEERGIHDEIRLVGDQSGKVCVSQWKDVGIVEAVSVSVRQRSVQGGPWDSVQDGER